ncbi:MAG: MerR family transcriptional regulator, thiopeptide resistance regulator [Pseudonocardiales bacterium]|jgi:DNA-binding transcriptional MerR regulator|nr:MerR family transcriptional regulator, thiopeptide resistance regulator [Pseudonocardiales bacterium]
MTNDGYSVGDVADLAHVSVRTLHHYDEIGLLRPTDRTAAGHRRYSATDLQRLREILFYRELDFGLDEIASLLTDSADGIDERLRSQHRMLRERIQRHQQLLVAIEKEMEARDMGISLTPEEQFEVFGTDQVGGEWADEADERWGDTAAYQESQRRTAAYTKDDWAALKAESDAGLRNYADAMRGGTPATSPVAMALAEVNRQFITRWFYDCGYDVQRGLAEMYIADERFRKTYDDVEPGLAQYVHDAIVANADAHS